MYITALKSDHDLEVIYGDYDVVWARRQLFFLDIFLCIKKSNSKAMGLCSCFFLNFAVEGVSSLA